MAAAACCLLSCCGVLVAGIATLSTARSRHARGRQRHAHVRDWHGSYATQAATLLPSVTASNPAAPPQQPICRVRST
jgi:hypothetical protein